MNNSEMAITTIITFGMFIYIKFRLNAHDEEIEVLQKRISTLEQESNGGLWC